MKTMTLNKWYKPVLAFAIVLTSVTASAQLKVTPTARLAFDGAVYGSKDVELNDGVAIRDFRIGVKGSYDDFNFKADVSLAYNKVTVKDVFLQYNTSDHSFIRGGHFTMPFGIQSAYGSLDKESIAEPSCNVYQSGRRLGLMHSLWNKRVWLAYGLFSDASSMTQNTNVSGSQGYIFAERFAYKPINTKESLLQLGLSYNYVKAEAAGLGKDRFFKYAAGYLTAVDKTKAVNAVIDHANYEHKYTFELATFYKNFALESQYYGSTIKRKDGFNSFNSKGFYIVGRSIILNRANYKYSTSSASISTPKDKALELSVGYSLLDMNDKTAGILGGEMNDVTAGLTFYWNKYVTLRTNYSYITVKTPEQSTKKMNVLQCRIQYKF